MTFEAIVDQALGMARRRGRVSYRMFKRHFALDDETFDDLKAEPLYAHPEVVDEAGRGLLWTGEPPASKSAPERAEASESRFHELYRLKGTLVPRQAIPDASQAEACFHEALDVARAQQAKSWELRAAMSLARLWQQQGKRQAPYDLLAPVCDWFTEGFDTADLKEAKALLDELE